MHTTGWEIDQGFASRDGLMTYDGVSLPGKVYRILDDQNGANCQSIEPQGSDDYLPIRCSHGVLLSIKLDLPPAAPRDLDQGNVLL
jgi:hypothetical protein